MSFEYNRPVPPVPSANVARNLGLLVLRLATGGALLYWHGWKGSLAAWSHIWHKTTWDLPGQLATLGFPIPLPLGLTLVVTALLGSLFLILGLLTRLSAVLLALLAVITALLYRAHPGIAEMAVLYTGACLTISLCGSGAMALDRLLRAVTTRRP